MVEYTKRYEFKRKEVKPIEPVAGEVRIIDERVKVGILTLRPIKFFTLDNKIVPVLSLPLVYNEATKSFEVVSGGQVISARVQAYYDPSGDPSLVDAGWYNLRLTSAGEAIVAGRSFVWDGSAWQKLRGDSEGRPIVVPLSATYDLGTFTATGTGSSTDTVHGFKDWTWMILTDASASAATVDLEGSIDGSNWFALDSWSGTGNTLRHVVNKPVRYIRAVVSDMGDATSISVKVFGLR